MGKVAASEGLRPQTVSGVEFEAADFYDNVALEKVVTKRSYLGTKFGKLVWFQTRNNKNNEVSFQDC